MGSCSIAAIEARQGQPRKWGPDSGPAVAINRCLQQVGDADLWSREHLMLAMPTNFLWSAGTAGNVGNVGGTNTGEIAPFITFLTTEISTTGSAGLASASGVISSANSTSGLGAGIFSNASTGSGTYQGIWGDVWFKTGGSATSSAPSAGANIAGWFLSSYDGVNFENVVSGGTGPTRPPDFIIPISTNVATPANSWYKSMGVAAVMYPPYRFKVYMQNNTGVALSAGTGALLVGAVVAIQY
jgi:hypothetical protein